MKKSILPLGAVVVFAAGCGGGDTIEIGAQTYTETKLIAYMNEALIEAHTDLSADVTPDISASPMVISALEEEELDIGLLYSGEVFNNHFEVEETNDPEAVLQMAQEGFDEHFNFKWFDPLGFENTYIMTVRADLADEYGLETVSDVEAVADELSLGVDTTWLERDVDGYQSFVDHYGFSFADTNSMDINLVYSAVANEEVDIVLAYSTDPRLIEYDLVTLEDDQQFFPPFDASIVAKNETLEEYPELEEVLNTLTGMFDEQAITELSYEVDINNRSERDVAREYLEEQGLLD
ncbi:osmotically activated L-carnitine/choline ABC transporter, substrate-binding protein OpuCC [Geomicrobium sp. JCM 19037]|uniref:glycine betaine ABC transporter substrate-binding protein n=1 Tax=unclassified Geomicrobium TaxID=2628951 RepID=UPI00045F4504|nr:glycine betaine ABC transporter substrate-binding protein [Geomicrobium sp. JCM 19037]GAK04944.1 osmotically activated L-carnitine/choline ABC transporter, substrate-binding protein OpuCC [Geomicrobium sp. JCM 19037]